jgi:adenylate cyclase
VSLFTELKRRNVIRVAAAYIVTAWLIVQVVETLFPIYGLSEAAVRLVVNLLVIGLVPVLVLSWVFEWTPEGIRREAEVGDTAPVSPRAARKLDRMILVVLALALGYFAFDRFVLAPQREATVAEAARQEGRAEAMVESYGDLSIAVLPFDDMSPEGDQEYFSDGIAEELLNVLARVPELRVTSRTSSFAFKGQALEVPEIARRLKVGHVLEGSVRKAGNQIRITAQLIDARSDTHLWSETWDRELVNVFAIQDEIAKAVVASLQEELLGGEEPALPGRSSETEPRAYELVLRGRHLLNQQDPEVLDRAQQFYELAIDVDPEYAPAWGGLAKTLMAQGSWKRRDPQEFMPNVESAVERALELDPSDPDALSTRGRLVWRSNDVEAAREHFRRALAVNPNDSDAYRWLGLSYDSTDPIRFLENIRKAYLVDPTNMFTNWTMVRAYRTFGQFEEAMTVARDYHRLDPGNWRPLLWAAEVRANQGLPGEALAYFNHLYRSYPDVLDYYDRLLWFHAQNLFDAEIAEAWLEEWKRRAGEGYLQLGTNLGPEAGLYILTGRGELAAELLEAGRQAGAVPDWAVALMTLRAVRGYARSRQLYERTFGADRLVRADSGIPVWPIYIDYLLILQQAGEFELADALAREIRVFIEEQIQAGVAFDSGFEPIRTPLAQLEAIMGNVEESIAQLQMVAASGLSFCLSCLRVFPHYDNLRGHPGFETLLGELDEEHARTSDRLISEGLLLYPDEIMAIEDWDFTPFAELPQ